MQLVRPVSSLSNISRAFACESREGPLSAPELACLSSHRNSATFTTGPPLLSGRSSVSVWCGSPASQHTREASKDAFVFSKEAPTLSSRYRSYYACELDVDASRSSGKMKVVLLTSNFPEFPSHFYKRKLSCSRFA